MNSPRTTLRLLAAACLTIVTAAIAGPAPPDGPPSEAVDFPVGVACAGFPLRVEVWSGSLNEHVLKDKNGFVQRVMFSGLGAAFRLTNLNSGKSLATRNNGASALVEFNPTDNSIKQTTNGHSLVVWFPTDVPAGPWTKLNSGKVVYSVSLGTGQGTLISMRGNATDVCAALS
jgi:hypothetical protein